VDARSVVEERRFSAAQSPPINRGFRKGRPGQALPPPNPVEFLGVKRENPMPQIRAIFWDVGGVLLTNAWDHVERTEALNHFHLDEAEFHDRHEMEVSSFEQGKITLDEYLDRTVFYRPRTFSREDFKTYMFSLTKPFPEVLDLARKLAESGNYLMGTINNESRELNLYRIEKNGLRNIFRVFVSSCFVGLRKPELEIYRMALEITQIPAEQCCFIDDRAPNLDPAAKLGIETIHMQSVDQLKKGLSALGVTA
jgi:putative hydrolase of the HAD superfamily